jgi:uncharacterized membrane protein
MPTPALKISFKTEIVPILLIVASFIFGFYFYRYFPDRVATHWDFSGTPNGYLNRFWGAFAMPFLLVFIYLIQLATPFFDPRRERYAEFAKSYHVIKAVVPAVLFVLYLGASYYNLGYNIDMKYVGSAAAGILFIVIGAILPKLKNNWFMGIRNPWTLSSEKVWNKTHRVGGYMFMLTGCAVLIAPYFAKNIGLIILVVGIGLSVIGTTLYSYLAYRAENK